MFVLRFIDSDIRIFNRDLLLKKIINDEIKPEDIIFEIIKLNEMSLRDIFIENLGRRQRKCKS